MLKSWLSIANQSVLDLINERFSFTYYRATYASLALLFSQNFIYIMIDVPRTTKYQLIFHYNYISYLPVTAMVKFIPTLDSGKYLSSLRNFSYYMEESVLLGTKPLVDSIRHFIRDPSGVFSVCHLCECRIVQ